MTLSLLPRFKKLNSGPDSAMAESKLHGTRPSQAGGPSPTWFESESHRTLLGMCQVRVNSDLANFLNHDCCKAVSNPVCNCLTLFGRRKLSWLPNPAQRRRHLLAERKSSICEAFRDFWTQNSQTFRDFWTQSSQDFQDFWAQSSLVESAMNCRFEVRSKTLAVRNSLENFWDTSMCITKPLKCYFCTAVSAKSLPCIYYFILLH